MHLNVMGLPQLYTFPFCLWTSEADVCLWTSEADGCLWTSEADVCLWTSEADVYKQSPHWKI